MLHTGLVSFLVNKLLRSQWLLKSLFGWYWKFPASITTWPDKSGKISDVTAWYQSCFGALSNKSREFRQQSYCPSFIWKIYYNSKNDLGAFQKAVWLLWFIRPLKLLKIKRSLGLAHDLLNHCRAMVLPCDITQEEGATERSEFKG